MTEGHIALEMDKAPNALRIAPNNQLVHSSMDAVDGRRGRVPRAVPEKEDDDDEFDDRVVSTDVDTGVDDGLIPPNERGHESNGPRPRRPSFAFPGGEQPGFVDINGVQYPVPDVNAYQHKKTLAQGMMDLALLSANANQLRYVLETYRRHPYYYPSLIFITLSIIFQVAVGVGLILNGRYNIKDKREICHANKINNYTVIGVFIVTVVNVFISAFGVADPINA